MNFEHLVEINDEGIGGLSPLNRAQLWRGLVLRAEQPGLSVLALDDCRILQRGADYLERELRFGGLRIRDRVRFLSMESVVYETEATATLPASRLTMTIEEPTPGRLFVRFVYAYVIAGEETALDRFYRRYLRQAYIEADRDTVATIRRLAQEGALQ